MNTHDKTPPLPLSKQLFNMTWPMMFGMFSMMSFQLVDSAFIGQLGVLPLATQGFTLPIQMILIGVQVGLGIATTAVIAKALGAGKVFFAKQLGGLVLVMGAMGVGVFGLLLYLSRRLLLDLLNAPQEVSIIVDTYWVYWLFSAWVGAILYFLYSISRANGNTLLPGSIMVTTSLTNLVLDPIFIFTLDMGINGAAIATILSFIIGIIMIAPKLVSRQWVTFNWQTLNLLQSVRSLLSIMGPAMVSQLLPPLSSMLATKLIAGFGTAAVAAWALGSRFEFFVIIAVLALTMSLPPMIGKLLGAKKYTDIRKLVEMACKFVLLLQFGIACLSLFASQYLTPLMTSDSAVESILHLHLSIVPFSLGPLGICMIMVSTFNALGRSYYALMISILRLFVFFLPCLWVGQYFSGIIGIFWGAFFGNILAGVSSWLAYQSLIRAIECETVI